MKRKGVEGKEMLVSEKTKAKRKSVEGKEMLVAEKTKAKEL